MAFRPRLRFDPIAEARRLWGDHGWEAQAPGMAAVTSVMRVEQILIARVDDVLHPLGLTFARYETLMLLSFSRRGSLPMGKMGERLQVHPASVTNCVNRLEADRLVRRRRHPTDGRATLAQITQKGRRLASEATGDLNNVVFGSLGLTDRELHSLFALLRKFRKAAGDFN